MFFWHSELLPSPRKFTFLIKSLLSKNEKIANKTVNQINFCMRCPWVILLKQCIITWALMAPHSSYSQSHIFFVFFLLFYYSYVHTRLGSFLPPAPTRSLTTHSTPSLSPPPPQYPAETILPLSLILLKRESISNNRKEQVFLLVEIRIAIQGVDTHWFPVHVRYLLG
jgi:hypothetical protein